MADDVLKTLLAEAYGEGPEGMRRVAETIINRAAIRGLSPEQVVQQPAQYTGLAKPGADVKRTWSDPDALAAAEAAWQLALQPGDPTGGADHYYAPGTINEPWWAKSMTPTGEHGGHAFYSSRPIPPGEIPNVVASLTDTVPRTPPAPVTATPDMAMMRRAAAPSQLIPDTFSSLSRGNSPGNAGDGLAMSPVILRGEQPTFDAAYDTRTGNMSPIQPTQTMGMGSFASRAPAPVPASVEDRVTARNRSLPPIVRLPELPPSGIGQAPSTRTVQSVAMQPPRPAVSASDLARGRSGISTVATIPTQQPRPSVPGSSYAGMERSPLRVQSGLPQIPGPSGYVNPYKTEERLASGFNIPDPVMVAGLSQPPTMMANAAPVPFMRPRVAPTPFPPYRNVATQQSVQPPRIAPIPFARPDFGIGGPSAGPAPVPAMMGQQMAVRRAAPPPVVRLPTRAPVNGGNTQQSAPQGFTDTGNGRLVSNETGGIYYSRHLG